MLDIKFIRENSDKVKEACRNKGIKVDVDFLLKIDKERRENLRKIEEIRAKKNEAGKEIIASKDKGEKEKIISEMRKFDKKEDELKKNLKELDGRFQKLMYQIPNPPFDDVPVGEDDEDNVVMRHVGEKPKFDFRPKDYLEIAEKLDIIDVKRAAKVSGSRFAYLKNEAVLIEFALINFVLDSLTKEGFSPVIPPVMLKSKMAKGTGYFEATDIGEAYYLPKDDLFLVGTSEQSLLTMRAGEIFEEKDLPKRYLGFSTCFRREAGSYGKDTKGILRVHQFDKLEMFSFCQPEKSNEEHQFLLSLEENLMKKLKIPYQVIKICTGDLGLPAAKKYDIESWVQSENRYRETHSCSNCTDFQARRLNIRYRSKKGKINFVHTLNGTAIAIGRILIAIIENYQQEDGTVKVPKVLQKYLGGYKKIPWLKRD
jgi:seryl-tRNA synthetase